MWVHVYWNSLRLWMSPAEFHNWITDLFPSRKPRCLPVCVESYNTCRRCIRVYTVVLIRMTMYVWPATDAGSWSEWNSTGTNQEGRVQSADEKVPVNTPVRWKLVLIEDFYCFLLISDHCWCCISQWFLGTHGKWKLCWIMLASGNYAKLCYMMLARLQSVNYAFYAKASVAQPNIRQTRVCLMWLVPKSAPPRVSPTLPRIKIRSLLRRRGC